MNYRHIETNLSNIQHLASEREDENYRFRAFLKGMIEYYAICPIVFNLMEGLKEEMRFRC